MDELTLQELRRATCDMSREISATVRDVLESMRAAGFDDVEVALVMSTTLITIAADMSGKRCGWDREEVVANAMRALQVLAVTE